MSMPRRRIVRPTPMVLSITPERQLRLHKLRMKLALERSQLARWMKRLRRAFHSVEKTQVRLTRLEKQLAPSEDT